ncbi:MAG TPA: TlpA disulfide reductase family protein, partial [Terriglobales bacterium]|nr:TlpA disulfide reductase family protein [Terriglobales bacterium]
MRRQALLFLILLFVLAPPEVPHPLIAADVGHRDLGHLQDESSRNPDFTLTDFNGKKLTLSQYKGKVVLVDFWASWCIPCQAEIPKFIEWQKKYGDQNFQVIGISMDDDEKAARKFVERLQPNYPIAMGNAKVGESFGGVLGLPANFVISRSGKIISG